MWSLGSRATFSVSAFWAGTFMRFECKKGGECVCDNTAFLNDFFCCSGLVFLYLSVHFCVASLFGTIPSFCVNGLIWCLWKVNTAQPLGTFFCIYKPCVHCGKYFLLERESYYWVRYFFSVAHVAVSTSRMKQKAVIVYLWLLFKVVYVQIGRGGVLAR